MCLNKSTGSEHFDKAKETGQVNDQYTKTGDTEPVKVHSLDNYGQNKAGRQAGSVKSLPQQVSLNKYGLLIRYLWPKQGWLVGSMRGLPLQGILNR
jgi:hypothetical protein